PAGDIVIPQARNYAWIWVLSAMLIITLSGWLASRRYPQWFAEPLPIKLERSFLSLGVQPPGILQLWARQMELRPIERMFTHIPWMLTALGQSPESGTTPQEQVERLIKGIPDATAPASVLLDQYQLAVYSPHPFNLASAHQAYLKLWRLVVRAAARRVFKWLPV
ncbi:MAG: hypothetical protein ROW39_09290, partial [Anaerolineaceae bacterium]